MLCDYFTLFLAKMQPIFQPVLNEQRMKYIAYHREIFRQLESERKK